MRTITIILLLSISSFVFAQADIMTTANGDLKITPVNHASLVLTYNEKTIYIDPNGDPSMYTSLSKPDLILITDIHGDHLNMGTLSGLETGETKFVVPQAVATKINDSFPRQIEVLNNGETTEQMGVSISAIPMYNLPETADSRHPKGRGNGYVLSLGGKKVYISGDTEDVPEMRNLKGIDVAFVCMNLPYTMDVNQAASAVIEFSPKIVYPYHYRGQGGLSDVKQFKELVNKGNSKVEVRLRDWYSK